MHDNAITELPEEIGALEKLAKANFSHNKLGSLPNSFYRLKDLNHLNLSHNHFTELNADVSDLVMLETLVRRDREKERRAEKTLNRLIKI